MTQPEAAFTSTFRSVLKPIYLVALLVTGFATVFLIIAIFSVGPLTTFSPVRLIIIALILYSVYGYGKIPWKIVIEDSRLTTHSFYGKRFIQLDRLKMATNVWTHQNPLQPRPGRGVIIRLIRLEDASGHSTYVQLGGLPEDERRTLAEVLTRVISQKNIQISPETEQLLMKWTKPESFWSA